MDPKAAAAAAMAEYDTNKDGYLDAKELERCPGLKCCLQQLDKDGDGKLSAAEIEERLAQFQQSRIGLIVVFCEVKLDDRPLADATVTLKPEAFLGSGIKPATGTTNQRGKAELRTEGADPPGCRYGFYRVEISKVVNGQETLAARYNSQSTLGMEVGPDMRGATGGAFRLSSR